MRSATGRAARAVAVGRAVVGAMMLSQPARVARLLDAAPAGSHPVLRVLGARHLLEALAIVVRSTRDVVGAGIVVDATHVLSCLLLGAVSLEHRRPALRDAAVGSGVLLATRLTLPEHT